MKPKSVLNNFLRLQSGNCLPSRQFQRFHNVASIYPAKTMIQKALQVFEQNGDEDKAAYWRRKGCQIYAGDFCEKAPGARSG